MRDAEVWHRICSHVVGKVISAHEKSSTTEGKKAQVDELMSNKGEFIAHVVKVLLDDVSEVAERAGAKAAAPPVAAATAMNGAINDLQRAAALKKQLTDTLREVQELREQLQEEFASVGFAIENIIDEQCTDAGLDDAQSRVIALEKTLISA